MNLQWLMDGLSAEQQRVRAASAQLTLGELIDLLKGLPVQSLVRGLGTLRSYRGYYSDLAFEPVDGTRSVGDLLAACQRAMGQVYTGYKGGDYVMGALTPLWVAKWGETSLETPIGDLYGPRLMGLLEGADGVWKPVIEPEEMSE